jgi:hypothetical protein
MGAGKSPRDTRRADANHSSQGGFLKRCGILPETKKYFNPNRPRKRFFSHRPIAPHLFDPSHRRRRDGANGDRASLDARRRRACLTRVIGPKVGGKSWRLSPGS